MKVLLTTLNSKFIHTNLAIRYIREYSRYLEGDDYSVMLREYTINNSIDYIMKDIVKMNVDMIVFSTYIWNI
ncbi:MAG: B12-binding domain-containing radical SAM protein, partial [Peptostreptococcus porci]|nr:B12-binding domain-containing radical SAM protein [Peptostreptococcus porci]